MSCHFEGIGRGNDDGDAVFVVRDGAIGCVAISLDSPRGMRAMTGELAVLGAPSSIGIVPYDTGEPRRLDLAPAALRGKRLISRLSAHDLGDVPAPPRYLDIERPAGHCRNEEDVAAYARKLAEPIAECRREERFVVVLGGDCSIVLGGLLGLRAADPVPAGLIYVDAHADFATLDESPSGSACSMALALSVARDEQPLTRLIEHRPLTSGDRAVHIGRREHADPSYGAAALKACGVLDLPMSAITSRAISDAARDALDRATARSNGFWVHFDVDVLDPVVMPATGDLAAGGIDFEQAAELLRQLLQHPAAYGLQVTLYDPTLDVDGRASEQLVAMLERVLTRRLS